MRHFLLTRLSSSLTHLVLLSALCLYAFGCHAGKDSLIAADQFACSDGAPNLFCHVSLSFSPEPQQNILIQLLNAFYPPPLRLDSYGVNLTEVSLHDYQGRIIVPVMATMISDDEALQAIAEGNYRAEPNPPHPRSHYYDLLYHGYEKTLFSNEDLTIPKEYLMTHSEVFALGLPSNYLIRGFDGDDNSVSGLIDDMKNLDLNNCMNNLEFMYELCNHLAWSPGSIFVGTSEYLAQAASYNEEEVYVIANNNRQAVAINHLLQVVGKEQITNYYRRFVNPNAQDERIDTWFRIAQLQFEYAFIGRVDQTDILGVYNDVTKVFRFNANFNP